jgi:hypothetical protein
MGHWCRICESILPNEKFSGKGHRNHICKKCSQLPRSERDRVDNENELFGYLKQSHISDKNIARLRKLAESPNADIAAQARLVLEIGLLCPYKRRRLKLLARTRRDLIEKLEETGLIFAHHS